MLKPNQLVTLEPLAMVQLRQWSLEQAIAVSGNYNITEGNGLVALALLIESYVLRA